MSGGDEAVHRRLARAVDGASFVAYHPASLRLFVWHSGTLLDVLAVDTAELLGNWPCEGTAASAASVVAERTNAGY
jgi:hypothetical protein